MIKFRYIYQHEETGRIMVQYFTLPEIEDGAIDCSRTGILLQRIHLLVVWINIKKKYTKGILSAINLEKHRLNGTTILVHGHGNMEKIGE